MKTFGRNALFMLMFTGLLACEQKTSGTADPETGSEGGAEEQEALAQSQVISAAPVRVETRVMEPYGRYLTDHNGRALYVFMADSSNPTETSCMDDCVADWPPLKAKEESTAGPDINPSLLGQLERPDGGVQVTYAGWPLYYYREDASGDTLAGQGLRNHGAEWYLLSPEGEPITEESEGTE